MNTVIIKFSRRNSQRYDIRFSYVYPLAWWVVLVVFFFFSSRRRHTRLTCDWSSDVCSSDLRDVTVTTTRGDGSTETATGIGALQVTAASTVPAILSLSPSGGAAGTTEDVRISGGATHFAAGSTASFGAGVTVNSLTVQSPTSAVAKVTVAPGAAIQFNDVSVQSGAENARVAHGFLVTPPTPPVARLTGASPASGARGTTVDVQLTGASTTFAAG